MASIDARFDISSMPESRELARVLEELEVACDEGELIVSREIHSTGRSVARLNGRPTTASILAQIGALVVDIHGQSDHLSLLRPAAQLELLDRFAHTERLRQELATSLGELRQVQRDRHAAETGYRERMQRIDLLRYQVDEIAAAGLQPGEDERLEQERTRLSHADRLLRDAGTAYRVLAGDDEAEAQGAAPALRESAQMLAQIAEFDPAVRQLAERTSELLYLLEDLLAELRDYRDNVEAEPERLVAVEERLDELRNLKRKYGAEVADILEHARGAEEEL
jgi:DNA repair protein RecN (Recombination protein N)